MLGLTMDTHLKVLVNQHEEILQRERFLERNRERLLLPAGCVAKVHLQTAAQFVGHQPESLK